MPFYVGLLLYTYLSFGGLFSHHTYASLFTSYICLCTYSHPPSHFSTISLPLPPPPSSPPFLSCPFPPPPSPPLSLSMLFSLLFPSGWYTITHLSLASACHSLWSGYFILFLIHHLCFFFWVFFMFVPTPLNLTRVVFRFIFLCFVLDLSIIVICFCIPVRQVCACHSQWFHFAATTLYRVAKMHRMP